MTPATGSTVGCHSIGDLVGIKNPKKWDSIEAMQKLLHGAAKKAGLTVLGENWEKFHPQGVSGFLFLSESHISIHFSPEHSAAWVDCFTCSGGNKDGVAMNYICKAMKPDMSFSNFYCMDRTFRIPGKHF